MRRWAEVPVDISLPAPEVQSVGARSFVTNDMVITRSRSANDARIPAAEREAMMDLDPC